MIVQAFIDGGFRLAQWIIQLIPVNTDIGSVTSWAGGAIGLLEIAGAYVPLDVFIFCIGNIIGWLLIHMIISIIRFVLDFIPFM